MVGRIIRRMAVPLAVFGGLAALQTTALADEIAGTATGSFPGGSTSYAGLTYKAPSQGFSGSTTDTDLSPLGSFDVDPTACWWCVTFYDTNFTLGLTFTLPSATIGSFKADVFGAMTYVGGILKVDFGNDPTTINYSNDTGTGSFDLTIQDVVFADLTRDFSPQTVHAQISNPQFTSVPEPSEFAELAIMLLGLALAARKLAWAN